MMQTQKTRIICISDTHNQTPKLPPGDVLIHAGDLTNQGSYSELRKTISWIESADFEAKIVVAGNHDTTLDEPFFISNGNKWKWPTPQSPEMCRKLLAESSSITYLEHEAAEIYLTSSKGPQTCFKIFGSPYSPGRRGWAFQYADDAAAQRLWSDIEDDNDIIITHTPAHGHCDETNRDEMSGCPILKQALARVRPMLHICGHIHDARGVERIRWSPSSPSPLSEQSTLGCVDCVEKWEDPGAGNKKISLLDLTARSRLRLDNTGRLAHTNLIVPRDLCVGPDQLDQYSYQNTGDRKGTWRTPLPHLHPRS